MRWPAASCGKTCVYHIHCRPGAAAGIPTQNLLDLVAADVQEGLYLQAPGSDRPWAAVLATGLRAIDFPFPIPFPFSSMLGKTVTPVVAIHEIYIPVGKISTMQVLSFGRLTLGFAGFRHSALELLPHPHTHTHTDGRTYVRRSGTPQTRAQAHGTKRV